MVAYRLVYAGPFGKETIYPSTKLQWMKLETVQSMSIEFFLTEVRFLQVINRGVLATPVNRTTGKSIEILRVFEIFENLSNVWSTPNYVSNNTPSAPLLLIRRKK